MQSERIEIVDFSGETLSIFTMPCWVVIVVVPLIVILDVIIFIIYPESPYATLLSIVLISIFIFYCNSVVTNFHEKSENFLYRKKI